MKTITAVIPTLLKNVVILNNLIKSLVDDNSVGEIIIINNSTEEFHYDNPKVRVLFNGKNLYVNPSWNMGVLESKNEYVTLVNDDIIIPPNFCSVVLEKMDDSTGIIGIDSHYVNNVKEEINQEVQYNILCNKDITITPVNYRTKDFGIMMFFNKKIYNPIPEDLKVFYGDDYLVYSAKKLKKQNAVISGQNIIHYGSLTSSLYSDSIDYESKIYKNKVFPWYKRILYFYERDTHYVFNILFMQFAIRKAYEF